MRKKTPVFHEGYLDYTTNLGEENLSKFLESKSKIVSNFITYSLEKIEGTNYYCIYRKYCIPEDEILTKEQMATELNNIINSYTVDDDIMLFGPRKGTILENIIWDTKNDIIFVSSMRLTRLVVLELFIESSRPFINDRPQEVKTGLINDACYCETINMTELNPEWKKTESRELLINAQKVR